MIRIKRVQRLLPIINPIMGVLILALFSGCIQVEQTLTLNPDGSGVVDLSYALSEDQAASLHALATELYEQDGEDHSSVFDASDEEIRKEFKEYEVHGVVLQSVQTGQAGGRKQRRLVISFQSLEGLARSGFLSDRQVSLVRNAQGDYVFTQAGTAGNSDELLMANEMAEDPMAAEMMQGFRVTLRIRTPSRILNTNAPEKTDRVATWRFDLDRDPKAVERVANLKTQVSFEGKGLNIREVRSVRAATP